jgi:hypothetical protein
VSLAGTPDPTLNLRPNVTGRAVVLLLSGHEDAGCNGFSELSIWTVT